MDTVARILITCPDKPGIVAAVAGFLHNHGVNITSLSQHSSESEGGTFFMRLEFQTPHLAIARPALEQSFQDVIAAPFKMDWRITYPSEPHKTAILVSKYDHALLEVLWRWKRGELPTEVTMVVSNHPDLGPACESLGVPFHHVPVAKDKKPEAEQQILALLDGHADLIVLARYMQILSPDFVSRYEGNIINIHHSFLPAFIGARPYSQAFERGVKIVGATAHYVTAELDQGPIIAQDIVHVDHTHTVRALTALGRNVEREVLAKAVRWHLEDRILMDGSKTVIFS